MSSWDNHLLPDPDLLPRLRAENPARARDIPPLPPGFMDGLDPRVQYQASNLPAPRPAEPGLTSLDDLLKPYPNLLGVLAMAGPRCAIVGGAVVRLLRGFPRGKDLDLAVHGPDTYQQVVHGLLALGYTTRSEERKSGEPGVTLAPVRACLHHRNHTDVYLDILQVGNISGFISSFDLSITQVGLHLVEGEPRVFGTLEGIQALMLNEMRVLNPNRATTEGRIAKYQALGVNLRS